MRALDEVDVVYVLNFGMYSDSGTAWEAGYAYAKGKAVINILVNPEKDIYSLMMLNAAELIDIEFNPIDSKEVEQK